MEETKELWNSLSTGPTPQVGILGPCPFKTLLVPTNEKCAPQREDGAPKKVSGLVPLESSSALETPKILVINPVFVGKKRVFADFAMKTFSFRFFSFHPRIREILFIFCCEDLFFVYLFVVFIPQFMVPPKNCSFPLPPSNATLTLGLP